MRFPWCLLLFVILSIPAAAQTVFPALQGDGAAKRLIIYSSLDEAVSKPLMTRFQEKNPDVEIVYHDLQTLEIYERVIAETDVKNGTADLVISSAMDLQMKLANDGYAQALANPEPRWPNWAKWRSTAFGLTFEPSVIVYHKPSFEAQDPPRNRSALESLLASSGDAFFGRAATYDIERSGLGFLFLVRDREHDRDIWKLMNSFGESNVKLYSNSSSILERVADGRLAVGYNILGSYAQSWQTRNPELGIILPEDFTVVMSRIALVPEAAKTPALGKSMLRFLMSREGQTIMADDVKLPALHPQVQGKNTMGSMRKTYGSRLRPITLGPGLIAYLDQVKRSRLIRRWNEALRGQ